MTRRNQIQLCQSYCHICKMMRTMSCLRNVEGIIENRKGHQEVMWPFLLSPHPLMPEQTLAGGRMPFSTYGSVIKLEVKCTWCQWSHRGGDGHSLASYALGAFCVQDEQPQEQSSVNLAPLVPGSPGQ